MAMTEWQQEQDERRLHERQVSRDQYNIRSRRTREAALVTQGAYIDPLDVPRKLQGRCGHKRKASWTTEAPVSQRPRYEATSPITQGQLQDALIPPTSPMSATEAVSRYGLITKNLGVEQRDIRHQDSFL